MAYSERSFLSGDYFELVIEAGVRFSDCGMRYRVTLNEMNARSSLGPPGCQVQPHTQNPVRWIRRNGTLLWCIGDRLSTYELRPYHSDRHTTHQGSRPWMR